jgi:hypothetical protein
VKEWLKVAMPGLYWSLLPVSGSFRYVLIVELE